MEIGYEVFVFAAGLSLGALAVLAVTALRDFRRNRAERARLEREAELLVESLLGEMEAAVRDMERRARPDGDELAGLLWGDKSKGDRNG